MVIQRNKTLERELLPPGKTIEEIQTNQESEAARIYLLADEINLCQTPARRLYKIQQLKINALNYLATSTTMGAINKELVDYAAN